MRRRRRRDYTPEQESATKELHRAERWLQIVSSGIAESLKREHYCGDGMRGIIEVVNKDLDAAVEDLENATAAHDKAFGYGLRRPRLLGRYRKPKSPRAGKSKSSAKQKAKNK